MLKIPVSEINKRHENLNSRYTISGINSHALYESCLKKYNVNNVVLALNNWQWLDENADAAYNKASELFELVYENGKAQDVKKVANIITENIIPKVRDATQLQDSIKRRISRVKTKITTKINNKIDQLKAAATGGEEVKKDQTMIECLQKMLEKTNINLQCDRVLNNHTKLSKRFNIDSYIKENVGYTKESMIDCITELCKFIDTYNVPLKMKYNVALENILYAFTKNHIVFENKDIVNTATDYFLMVNENIKDMQTVIENSKFYLRPDLEEINFVIGKKDGEKQFDFFFNSEEDTYAYDSNDIRTLDSFVETSNRLDKILEASKENQVKQLINQFKLLPKKTPEALKSLVMKIFTRSPEDIVEETPNMLTLIFTFTFSIWAASISIPLAILAMITTYFVSMHLERKQAAKVLDSYKKHKERVEKKLEKAKSESDKEKYKQYVSQLDKDISKLEDYYDNLLTDDEKAKLDTSSDDDFDFNFNESVKDIILIESELAEIDWSELELAKLIDDGIIGKVSMDDMDSMTEFAIKYPDVFSPKYLLGIYESHLEEIKKEPGIKKYIRMDCLNENIRKLNVCINNPYEIVSENANCVLEDLRNINLYTKAMRESMDNYKNGIVLEMDFTNTLRLNIERLKKTSVNLSDKEKTMSRTVDSSLEMMRNKIEDAMTNENREAVIRGNILPPASKIIKLAITTGLAWVINPALAVITLLGTFAMNAKIRTKERQLILDELDVELVMVDKYIRIAEEKNDMKNLRELLKIKKKLQNQEARLKYKMNFEWNQKTPNSLKHNDDED